MFKTSKSIKSDAAPVADGLFSPPLRSAFTLVELLAVIAIIGILVGLTFLAAQAVRQSARRALCSSNVRQLMTATLNYESSAGAFPAADNGNGGSFVVSLLSYIEQSALDRQAQERLAPGKTYQDRWLGLSNKSVEVLICPATAPADNETELEFHGKFTSHYFGVAGPAIDDLNDLARYRVLTPTSADGPIGLQGLFSPTARGSYKPRRHRDVTDGTSNTLAFGEIAGTPPRTYKTSPDRGGWAYGADYNSSGVVIKTYSSKTISKPINLPNSSFNDIPFRSNHPDGVQFALIDGSTHFIEDEVDFYIFKAMSTVNGQEAISATTY